MNVLSIHRSPDLAGISGEMARAFAGHPSIKVRSLVRQRNYLAYPLTEPWSLAAVRDAAAEAEVIHVHNSFRTAEQFRLPKNRRYVVHHHGTRLRESPTAILREQQHRRARGVVSTLDLWLLAPDEMTWVPAPVNVDRLCAMRQPREGEVVRIAHAPTRRKVKSTDAFLAACDRLIREGYPIEVDLIERVSWETCLRRKATADIYFDQVMLGYGSNALEAWAMGIPVIAGAADDTKDAMVGVCGELPFYEATPSTIYEALRDMVCDADLRREYADRGHAYVRARHDYPAVVPILSGVWQ